jgi:hypothetical protein
MNMSAKKIDYMCGSLIECLLHKSIHAITAKRFEIKVAFLLSLPASTSFGSNLGC